MMPLGVMNLHKPIYINYMGSLILDVNTLYTINLTVSYSQERVNVHCM